MSTFTIRVELHDASWQNYVDMANDLATKGVRDVITAADGTTYKMPPAEYNYIGSESIDDVLQAVRASAAKTGRRNAVFVTEATRQMWIGLDTIAARRTA